MRPGERVFCDSSLSGEDHDLPNGGFAAACKHLPADAVHSRFASNNIQTAAFTIENLKKPTTPSEMRRTGAKKWEIEKDAELETLDGRACVEFGVPASELIGLLHLL